MICGTRSPAVRGGKVKPQYNVRPSYSSSDSESEEGENPVVKSIKKSTPTWVWRTVADWWKLWSEKSELEFSAEDEERTEEEIEDLVDVVRMNRCVPMSYVVRKLLGQGVYGSVFEACPGKSGECSKRNMRVIKFQILDDFDTRTKERFDREVEIATLAYAAGLSSCLTVDLHWLSEFRPQNPITYTG
jgi:hypothetical protein